VHGAAERHAVRDDVRYGEFAASDEADGAIHHRTRRTSG
jgi:hypothetical protein